ncbi:MAG: hypothetical protein OXC54_04280 [Rhodospirillaceae bacterium]|nr:hypothetical protein [Rhodospirillaceae bacterium]
MSQPAEPIAEVLPMATEMDGPGGWERRPSRLLETVIVDSVDLRRTCSTLQRARTRNGAWSRSA